MNKSKLMKAIATVVGLALLLSGTPVALGYLSPSFAGIGPSTNPLAQLLAPSQQSAAITFADPAFQTTWQRTDLPVQNGKANRSWMWGPTSIYSGNEPWAESPGGQHLVQYFDKSRMEVNDPNGDRSSQWFVTNGLLVVEMMTGRIATGTTTFTQTAPAAIPVAGDVATSVNAPTYATLAGVASLQGNNRAPDETGQPVEQILDRAGNVSQATQQQNQVVNVVYEPTLGHNIPNVFWTFMNQTGTVYQNGQYVTDKVFDWVFAMGYPLTEPYWIQISVGGQNHWVVMQAYQRRIITYDPNNDPNFQVEMGNAGQAYYNWRYNQQGGPIPSVTPVPPGPTATLEPAAPTPTATPPPALTLNPTSGAANTTITVSGSGYMPFGAVNISVAAPANSFNRNVATVGADAAGNFSTYITLPGEVAGQPNVTITAIGPNGVPTLSQQFTITRTPSLAVTPLEVTSRGIVELSGANFTANTPLTISAQQVASGAAPTTIQVTTDGNGAFRQNYTLQGRAPVGAQYTVVATGPNNLRAQAPGTVRIIPQPSANVNPSSGPAGVNVTFGGSNWPANRLLTIKLQGDNGQYQTLQPTNPVVTDAAGNFSTILLIPQQYAGQTRVTLWASDDTIGLSQSAPYNLVNSTPPPANPTLNIVPNPIQSNQSVQVYGAGYPAGQIVSVTIGAVGQAQGPAASTSADVNGNFNARFTLPASLAGAGMVAISATSTDGTSASVNVTVVNNSGGNSGGGGTPPPPSGLPMSVNVNYFGGPGSASMLASPGTGWPAGQSLIGSVISADGSVNQNVATGAVRADGSFQIGFEVPASLAARTDLSVKVAASSGASSVRYLPVTSIVNTGGGTYSVEGANWPRSTKITAQVVPVNAANQTVASADTDATGVFRMTVTVPSNLQGNVRTIQLLATNQPYSAAFTP